jgi:hypothetical protein
MSTERVVIKPVVPPEFINKPLSSSSKHILRNRFEEITPLTSATEYSYNGNSRLEFLINSSADFVDFQNSYLRFDLTTTMEFDVDAAASPNPDATRALATGGAHSIFREIRIESSNGVILNRIDRYNKFYAMYSTGFDQDYVENVGAYYGDSIGSADVTHLTGSDNTPSAREYYANTNAIVVCMQPLMPLLLTGAALPVALIRGGLKIIFELERPEYILQSNADTPSVSNTYSDITVKLDNPRYIVNFIQPSQEVMSEYLNMYNKDGLHYNYSRFHYSNQQVAAGSAALNSFQFQPSVRSAKNVFTFQQGPAQETIVPSDNVVENDDLTSTFNQDSIGTFLKANLSSYQCYSGALRFPLQRPIDTTDPSNSELFQHFRHAQGLLGTSIQNCRANVEQWMERDSLYGNTDSTKLVIANKLGRGDDSYSGLDISVVPLTVDLEYDAVFTTQDAGGGDTNKIRYIHNYIEADETLSISSNGMQTRV